MNLIGHLTIVVYFKSQINLLIIILKFTLVCISPVVSRCVVKHFSPVADFNRSVQC